MGVTVRIPTPLQRLTWTDDTFENIRAAFDAFIEASATAPRLPQPLPCAAPA